MSLTIAGRLFTGPFQPEKAAVRTNQEPAVYAVVVKQGQPWDPQFVLIDAGETGEDGLVFTAHPAYEKWKMAAGSSALLIYLHIMPRAEHDAADRKAIVTQVWEAYPEPNMIIRR